MKDFYLELIVKFAEADTPIETPVTLIVGGFLVSGHIISKDKFMQQSEYTAGIEKDVRDALDEMLQEPHEDDGNRRFIHLRDAQYFTPGQTPTPTNGKVYCRVKLSHVAGFHLGYLSIAPQEGDSDLESHSDE